MKYRTFHKPSFARLCILSILSTSSILSGCTEHSDKQQAIAPAFSISENFPGGETSVPLGINPSFQLPTANIPDELKSDFFAGQALAKQPWVKAPTVTFARDGLGPIYNARTCLSCHVKGGKGFIPGDSTTPIFGTILRLSKAGDFKEHHKQQGVIPHPTYGDQIQGQSISLAHQLRHVNSTNKLEHDIAPEAYVYVDWEETVFQYPHDGKKVNLRKPVIRIENLGYGPLGDNNLYSLRIAPPIHGMGLIELIPQSDIDQLADEQDKNNDGISGRLNQVWNIETQSIQPGRFGAKANKPTLAMTVAGAFTNDLGITTPLFPNQPCTSQQRDCLNTIHGNDKEGVELPQNLLNLVVDFNRNLAPLKRRNVESNATKKGRELFYQVGCHKCHQPSFKTGSSSKFKHLSEQFIWPYSDFLLHDMGNELADNRPDFLASGHEWRTPPLWGIGIQHKVNGSTALLHDGRARSIEEAILWHGGEAETIKSNFVSLDKTKRNQLLEFVKSL